MTTSQAHLPGVPTPPSPVDVDAAADNDTRFPTALDIPCGCGGATLGMQHVGYNVLAGLDLDVCAWYAHHEQIHYSRAIQQDMTDVDVEMVKRIAAENDPTINTRETAVESLSRGEIGPDGPGLVDAGFFGTPCQGFSSAGKKQKDDDRNELAFTAVEWVEAVQPRIVMMENVPGMKKNYPDVFSSLQSALSEAGPGYYVGDVVLNSAEYGVPQARDRVFVMAVRSDFSPPSQWAPEPGYAVEPQQTLTGRSLEGYRTAGEALEELPDPLPPQKPADDPVHMVSRNDANRVIPDTVPGFVERDGEEVWMPPNHVAADHGQAYQARKADIERGYFGSPETDRRLHPEKPAPTMTVSQGTPPFHYQGKSPANPDGTVEDVRRLTVREVARLQTFPDSFTFPGTKEEQFRLAGNAVPPVLAAHVSSHLGNEVLF